MKTTSTMQATWYEETGSTEVLQSGTMSIPSVGANEVLVKVYASGLNPSDIEYRSGWGDLTMSFPRVIPHQDGAGIIEQVGANVSSNRIGQRVWLYEAQMGRPFGTAAEYVVVPNHQAIQLPDRLTSLAEGACLGVPAMTAHRSVFGYGPVKGQTILVTGGAGAVGFYAIQLAKWGNATTVITTVSRPEQAALALAAGADYVINYKKENVVERIRAITGSNRGVDRVIDVDFEANLPIAKVVLNPNGSIATYASSKGNPDANPGIPFFALMDYNITIQTILVYTMPEKAKQEAIRDITIALSQGALQHNIARRFPLHDVAAAHDAQVSGTMIGKAIIEIMKEE
jgi:NADPH:quinone reductase